MGNNTKHYIGAYLKLNVNKSVIEKEYVLICENNHVLDRNTFLGWMKKSSFCSECGSRTRMDEIENMVYPVRIDDILDDEKWVDELSVITPPSLFNTGVIICISNTGDSFWLYLDGHDDEMSDIPSSEEIEQMKKNFVDTHDKILTELEKSPHVKNMSIEFGYVVDMEY